MQMIVLAGGASVRFGGPSAISKPLVSVLNKPLLLHAIRPFSEMGFERIHIAAGANYLALSQELAASEIPITVHDTGVSANTGGRLKQVASVLDGERFLLTYADGLARIDVQALLKSHIDSQRLVTATLCNPRASYGIAQLEGDRIEQFQEKPILKNMWVNGGFYVLEKAVLNQIRSDDTSWEADVLPQLAEQNQLSGFKHHGEWVTVDSQKDLPAAEAAVRRWGYD